MGKPPIGLTPQYIWKSQRIEDILSAIERYSEAKIPIPIEWVKELKQILT